MTGRASLRSSAPRRRGPAADAAEAIDLGPLPQLVGYMLRRAQLAVFQDFMELTAGLDIRPAHYSILAVVAANRDLKQVQVCDALAIKRANLVGLIDELEQRGLLLRVQTLADRRSRTLRLTKAGERLLARLDDLLAQHERRLASRLGEDGKDKLLEFLARLAVRGATEN